jgi:DNA helicase-2/ATP-dependent DNA helicase PcrA
MWLQMLISELDLPGTLKDSEQFPNEVENLVTLLAEAEKHHLRGATVERFARLGAPDDEVTLTTRHSAKGLEFEAVVLLGMEEGRFPYKGLKELELQEAQRLCYVCVSRAKKTCVLVRSVYHLVGYKKPQLEAFAPSRFWVALHQKFGAKENTFEADAYPG